MKQIGYDQKKHFLVELMDYHGRPLQGQDLHQMEELTRYLSHQMN